jgi:hypothetical protein
MAGSLPCKPEAKKIQKKFTKCKKHGTWKCLKKTKFCCSFLGMDYVSSADGGAMKKEKLEAQLIT